MTRKSAIYNHAAALDEECREAYQLYLESYLATAEEVTRGALVNARGRNLGFQVMTYADFERQWLQTFLGGAA